MKEIKNQFETTVTIKLEEFISKQGKKYKSCIVEFPDGTRKYIGFEKDYKILYFMNAEEK